MEDGAATADGGEIPCPGVGWWRSSPFLPLLKNRGLFTVEDKSFFNFHLSSANDFFGLNI